MPWPEPGCGADPVLVGADPVPVGVEPVPAGGDVSSGTVVVVEELLTVGIAGMLPTLEQNPSIPVIVEYCVGSAV